MSGREAPPPLAEDPEGSAAEDKVRRAELAISLVLRIGVTLAAALALAGIVLVLVHNPQYTHGISYHEVIGPNYHFPHTIGQLGHALAAGDGRGYIGLGLVVLIATPVLRVAVAVGAFMLQRDPRMTVVTLAVLVLLIGSFFIGGG